MTARGISRRSLLAATAGAVAGGLTRPGGVLAALAGPAQPTLQEHWVGALPAGGLTVGLTRSTDLVGVEWRAPADARVELRFRGHDGRWSGWVPAAGCAGQHGHARPAPADRVVGDPVWTGGTRMVGLRANRGLRGVRLHLVDVSGGMGAHRQAVAAERWGIGQLALAAALPTATPVLAGQPPILARRAWARGMAHPRVAPGYGAVRLAFVHHTQNPNGYAPGEVPGMLRAIFVFHRHVKGWNDIGYNFVIDSYGRVWEGRAGGIDEPVVGAQAGGYNLVSTGVAVLGSFASRRIPPAAQGVLERLLAWKLSLHGISAEGSVTVRVNPAGAVYSRFPANARVSLPRIAGHRDGDSTDCPGDALYRELPAMRQSVRRLAPRPARATLTLLSQPAPPNQAAGEAHVLAGSLTFLDGTPIAGAPIMVQARSVRRRGEVVNERTIAEAVTDAAGKWSLPASFSVMGSGAVWLRALCAGAPNPKSSGVGATVSEPLHAPEGALLSPPEAPPPTPPAAPPPAT
jgi:hypothetical protein